MDNNNVNYNQPQNNNGYYYQQPQKKSNTGLIVAIIILLIALIAGGIVLFFVLSNKDDSGNNTSNTNSNANTNTNTNTIEVQSNEMVVGNDTDGYVTVPSTWVKFTDVNNPNLFQYAKDNSTIVTLYAFNPNGLSPVQCANNLLNTIKAESGVTDIVFELVTIGKPYKYSAYHVSATYTNENSALHVYIFDLGNGKYEYLALEAPLSTIDQYLYIPDTFSKTK